MLTVVQVLGVSNEDEMVACFLSGELSSQRFGQNLRSHLAVAGQAEQLLTHPDLSDAGANFARRALLAATRGYGENRDLFENFPAHVTWTRALLSTDEAADVRYLDNPYWVELSGGSRGRPTRPHASRQGYGRSTCPTNRSSTRPTRSSEVNDFLRSSSSERGRTTWSALRATCA
ncbi:hypothetical protein SLAVM298S_03150 [Streptomyces lavendulae subsp. lavendulae]